MPPVDVALLTQTGVHDVGYHNRTGKHDVTEFDWEQYLNFADMHWGVPTK